VGRQGANDGTPLGKYLLFERIGSGGMAEVYRARHEGPAGFAKDLVIKMILPAYAEESKFVEMFLNEARLAALLDHPNIVHVFDFGREAGRYFIAMEYVRGPTLRRVREWSRQLGVRTPCRVLARIFCGICQGLQHAHDQTDAAGVGLSIVHRDISPDNVIVSRDGVPKILDFGIAKATAAAPTTQGLLKGKYSYMPPEQVSGGTLDRRADLYSLGVVMYELVTGRKPFVADETQLFRLLEQIVRDQPPLPRALRPDIPIELEAIIMRCLAKDPARRFQSAYDLRVALESFLAATGEPQFESHVAEYLADLARRAGGTLEVQAVTGGSLSSETPTVGKPNGASGRVSRSLRAVEGTSVREGAGEVTPLPGSGDRAYATQPVKPVRTRGSGLILGAAAAAAVGAATALFLPDLIAVATSFKAAAPTVSAAPPPGAPDQVTPAEPSLAPTGAAAERTGSGTAEAAAPGPTVPEPEVPAPAAVDTEIEAKPVAATPTHRDAAAGRSRSSRPGKRGDAREANERRSGSAGGGDAQERAKTDPSPEGNTGSLTVHASPWCTVYLGSRKLGDTPLVDVEAPEGRHRLRCVNQEGGLSSERMVVITAGQKTSESFRVEQGQIDIRVKPWAKIWIDGHERGMSPIGVVTVRQGKHQVRLVNSDLKVDRVMTVDVAAGRRTVLRVDLTE
jgi:eukaryotic-like serine/threonine-protein kinase